VNDDYIKVECAASFAHLCIRGLDGEIMMRESDEARDILLYVKSDVSSAEEDEEDDLVMVLGKFTNNVSGIYYVNWIEPA
jgi:hypothetical protein